MASSYDSDPVQIRVWEIGNQKNCGRAVLIHARTRNQQKNNAKTTHGSLLFFFSSTWHSLHHLDSEFTNHPLSLSLAYFTSSNIITISHFTILQPQNNLLLFLRPNVSPLHSCQRTLYFSNMSYLKRCCSYQQASAQVQDQFFPLSSQIY